MSVLDYLIEKGADMLGNCLELACDHNNYEMVKLLLINEKNDFDKGMIASCKNGNMEIFKLFFKINLNKKIKTYSSKTKGDAACIACQYGHIDIVKHLIDQDVKVFTKLLNISCLYGHFELVKYIYSSFPDKVNINTGMENACQKEGNIDIINFLVDKGVIEYDESFKIAAKHNNPKNLTLLLSKGASNLNDALLEACYSKLYSDFTEVINILINHGADNIALVLRLTYDHRNSTSFDAIVKNICKY
jgi:ankyrin repeat protein